MKSRKKFLGILLTASIIAATVFPMQGTAAEGIDYEMKSETQKKVENEAQTGAPETGQEMQKEALISKEVPETEDADQKQPVSVSANIPPAAEMDDYSIMPASYDINQPVMESFELEENGETLTKNDSLHLKMSAYDSESGIKSIDIEISKTSGYPTKNLTLTHSEGNIYTATFPCSKFTGYEGEYYISKIRLEDYANNYIFIDTQPEGEPLYAFTIDNSRTLTVSDFQMQTNASDEDGKLRVGDTVTYTARLDSQGIEEVIHYVRMYLATDKGDSRYSTPIQMTYDAETKILTGTYRITESTYPSEWELDYIYIYVQENVSDSFYPSKIEPDKNLKFTVVNDDYDTEKPVIKSISIDKNGQMVKAGDTVTVKVKVEEENPSDRLSIRFESKESGTPSIYLYPRLNRKTMEYSGTLTITEDTYPTKWELVYLYACDENDNGAFLSDFQEDWETTRPWYFTVDPEGYVEDNEDPVIESITIDKNGQWVQPGDTVTMKVKVDEKNPSSMASASFYPQASNVSDSARIYLDYHSDTKEYIGSVPINYNTYPCEWMLTDLTVSDTKGHYAYLSDFKADWGESCPWYYRVKSDDTYREDVKDVYFTIYGLVLQEDGSYQYGYLMDYEPVKNVGRRASLKELGVWPSLPAEKNVNVTCTEGWGGPEFDGDKEFYFGNKKGLHYYLYAYYDKVCVNVVLTYITKEEGVKTIITPQFVDPDATYKDMLDSLQLPEDGSEEFFAGFKLDASYDETAQVAETGYVGVEAEYNDCVIAWNMKYLDENGNEVSKVIPKSYKKGTVLKDALANLEGPKAPEGMEFEKWALPNIDGNETITHEMGSLNITAVYKGKTTADVSYTYRGEDGKFVSDTKLMLLDGENLSYAAALEEIEESLKELKHMEGLTLSGWKKGWGIDIARYKKVNIQAQYDNCVVILKYPNEETEYVIVDKGSDFTLPVENEKYIDILWEGHGKGEIVTITEDKEFLVADAKPKDGVEQEPPDGTLSEKEIEKIIADIEQGGSGETIHVDMRKATIVPKEVLEAIQGKEVNIVLDMGAYSWSIGGNDVNATNLRDIDLEVIVDTDVIPPTIVDSLAEGKPATQISLIHDGEFGFRADLTVNLGSEHSGSVGKLYYYDSAGKLVYRDAGEIGEDGNISLSFSHASDYVVVIEKASSDIEDDDQNNSLDNDSVPGDNDDNGHNSHNSSGQETSAAVMKAGDSGSPDAAIEKDNDAGKRKSPKTGE